MLNTDSRVVAGLVWLAIAAIGLSFLWSYFDWPHAYAALRILLDSEIASFAARNQVIVSGLLGFGALAVAYVLNGWRDRHERRGAKERSERRDGSVLAREAAELAVVCEQAARQLNVRGAPASTVVADLKLALAPGDHLLLSATPLDLARLGQGAAGAARAARASIRRLAETLDTAARDEAAARAIATRAVEAAFAARSATRIFEALAKGGPDAADRMRRNLHDVPAPAELQHEEEPRRLLPAA